MSRVTFLLTLTAAVCMPIAGTRSVWTPHSLSASPVDPMQDSDGDMLPDNLEWTLMSDPMNADSDGDGRSDFVEAVQHSPLRVANGPQPVDHELRVALCAAADPTTGTRYVWMHCLFRFASGQMDARWLQTTLSGAPTGHMPIPIDEVFGREPTHITVQSDPTEGLMAAVSVRLAPMQDLVRLTPCCITMRAMVGDRYLRSTVPLIRATSTLCALVPNGLESNSTQVPRFIVQSLAAHTGAVIPGAHRNRVCEQALLQTGMSMHGPVYEVVESNCLVAEGLRCPSECPQLVGTSHLLPDGLAACYGR